MTLALATYKRVAYPRVCVCGQERELPIVQLPARPFRVNAPDRNMDKHLRDSNVRVDDEAERLVDFKSRKWKFLITAKVRAADC